MQVEFEQQFFAPLPDVASAFDDQQLLNRVATVHRLRRTEVLERVADGDTIRERVRYTYTGDLSPAMTAIVDPSRLTWVEESTLDRTTHRRCFTLLPDHYPDRLSCSGTVEFHGNGQMTTRRTRADLEVHIPVVGAQVARAIAAGLRDYAAAEARVVQEWLDARNCVPTSGVPTALPESPPAIAAVANAARSYGAKWRDTLLGLHEASEGAARAAGSAGRHAADAVEQLVVAWARWRREV